MITPEECSEIINFTILETEKSDGGFVMSKLMKSVKLFDLAKLISENINIIGLRDGEELDEDLVNENEIENSLIIGDYVKILNHKNEKLNLRIKKPISSKTSEFMGIDELKMLISVVKENIVDKKIY